MKSVSTERGSVLMEFLLVFPVYLSLIAGTFMLGDSLARTIRLSSEERTEAFDAGGGVDVAARSRYYADTQVEGAWTFRSAVKAVGWYSLPGIGVAGQLDYADRTLRGRRAEGDYATLIRGGEIAVYSRDERGRGGLLREYRFNQYVLRRDKDGVSWRDGGRCSSDLVCARGGRAHNWESQVYGEVFHGEVNDETNARKSPPSAATFADEYARYQSYVVWSE